ncbi:MAG TPA: hypothetical protein VNB68_02980 [Nitrososphaeraceae archaeon]|nr:hypothetical protein [Nitrososphaeraceae archaeon]
MTAAIQNVDSTFIYDKIGIGSSNQSRTNKILRSVIFGSDCIVARNAGDDLDALVQ